MLSPVTILTPPLLVLASLAKGPKHGHAMIEDIERLCGTRLGPGTLPVRLHDWSSKAGFRRYSPRKGVRLIASRLIAYRCSARDLLPCIVLRKPA
jgi:hypothetical protein